MGRKRADRRAPWPHPLAAARDLDGTPIRFGPDTPNGHSAAERERTRVDYVKRGYQDLPLPRPIRPARLGRPRAGARAQRVEQARGRRNAPRVAAQ